MGGFLPQDSSQVDVVQGGYGIKAGDHARGSDVVSERVGMYGLGLEVRKRTAEEAEKAVGV